MNKQCPNCSQAMEEGESTIEGTPLFFLFYGMSRMFLFFRGASYFVAWAVPIYGETNNAVFNQAHLTSIKALAKIRGNSPTRRQTEAISKLPNSKLCLIRKR